MSIPFLRKYWYACGDFLMKRILLFSTLPILFFVFVGLNENVALENDMNSQVVDLIDANVNPIDSYGKGGSSFQDEYFDILSSEIALDDKEYHSTDVSEQDENGVRIYVVQKGDTLSEIAEKFDVSVNTIRWENNIKGNTLRIGQELRILPTSGILHRVRKGDTLAKIAKEYGVSVEDITIYNAVDAHLLKPGMEIMVPNGVKKEKKSIAISYSSYKQVRSSKKISSSFNYRKYYIRPAQGRVSSPFGPRRRDYHYGIDIAKRGHVPIVAAASGTVVKTVSYCRVGYRRCGGGYGNHIIIRHSNGTYTKYAHLKKVYVRPGEHVVQGQKIGQMGNTGLSTGQHLHFEIEDIRTGARINTNFLR